MSERTRIEVWEQLRAADLVLSDEVVLPVGTVKLLLECARLVNEAAATKPLVISERAPALYSPLFNAISDQDLRGKCRALSQKL